MKRRCLYICPNCNTSEFIRMRDLERIVTCTCMADDGYPTIMTLYLVMEMPV